jgi:hypothetical protein
MQERGWVSGRASGNSTLEGYGQGSIWAGVGVWCSACGEDADEGGGRGDDAFGSDAGGDGEGDSTRPAAQTDRVAEKVVRTQRTVAETKKHAGRLGRSVWTPVARFSSVVWLQVTGLFFGLIAMFLAQGAWKERAAWRLPVGSHAATKFWVLVVAFAAFAYFACEQFCAGVAAGAAVDARGLVR